MRRVLAVLVLSLISGTIAAQSRPPRELRNLDGWIAQAMRDWEVPGLAVAVVHGDSMVFAKGYGVRALGARQAVTTRTLFANASTTKAFTAMGVGLMIDEGKLDWSDHVTDRLPELVLHDPYPARELTIRDLLSHRVGFGDPSYLWYGTNGDAAEIFRRVRFVMPESSFRSRYAYNNVTFAAAGVIAGVAYGPGWSALIHDRILTPLGMAGTVTEGRSLPPDAEVALPHDLVHDTLQVLPGVLSLVDDIAPAGAMYSNVEDMARWLRFLLAGGRVGDSALVDSATFAQFFQPQTIIPTSSFYSTARRTRPHFTAYGMGWFLQDYRGELVAFHTGSIDGYVAIVGLVPGRDVGVVVFANRDHTELRHAIMWQVFDAYLGGAGRDWSAELKAMYDSADARQAAARAERDAQRIPDTRPSLALDRYAATYADSALGDVVVRLEHGRLRLSRSDFLTGTLEHWHLDTFRVVWDRAWLRPTPVTFGIGVDGEVAEMEMEGMTLGRR